MAKNNSKRLWKLRSYRDKLIEKNVIITGKNRYLHEVLRLIRKSLQKDDSLTAYAYASDPDAIDGSNVIKFSDKNELAKELALVYRFLIVERQYTKKISIAASQRDYLRVAALASEHAEEHIAHDKMLSLWSEDHGFTKRLRKELKDEKVA